VPKKFEPPSEQEVAEYMVKMHHVKPSVAVRQAEQFMGYYESRGWAVGKSAMKSWHGAVRQWTSRFNNDMLSARGIMNRAAKFESLRKQEI